MGVNDTDKLECNFAVNKLEDNYVVDDVSGESFYQKLAHGQKLVIACQCEAKKWMNIQMFTAEGEYP